MAPIESPEPVAKPKKEKKDKSAKKRAREEDAVADSERKHKKSKSIADSAELANGDVKAEKKEKKDKKKKKKEKHAIGEEVDEEQPSEKKEKKHKKKKKHHDDETNGHNVLGSQGLSLEAEAAALAEASSKKKKKSKKHHETDEAPAKVESDQEKIEVPASDDAMDIDIKAPPKPSGKIHQPPDIPPNPQFPFFDQTVSLYEPLYPTGWDKPITGCESQHLRHLRNRYVPILRGVLLDYSNVTLGQKPGRAGAAASDEEPTMLISKTEFGGGFGWLTADVKLFVPTRGAWMEGAVNLQTEGHIGVVCYGKFNASVEARRLPPSWKWVPNDQGDGVFEETASVVTAPDEHGVVRQIHSTGYWVDAAGDKIKGKVRFRIRNFDVGMSGDSTYLSLQGTMLDKKSEKKLVETEAREARDRKARKGGRGSASQSRRHVPDFSISKLTSEEDETRQVVQDADEVRDALANEE